MEMHYVGPTATATHVTSCSTTLPCLMPMHTSGQELVVMAHGGCNLEIPAETIQQDQIQSWPSRDIVSRLVGIMPTSCIKKHHVVETCYQGLITIILMLHSAMQHQWIHHPMLNSNASYNGEIELYLALFSLCYACCNVWLTSRPPYHHHHAKTTYNGHAKAQQYQGITATKKFKGGKHT